MNTENKGWKPIPLALKILFVVLLLWAIGSLTAVPMRYESGLPFFGAMVHGILASLTVVLLDVLAPLTFLFGLWNRKSWAPYFAFAYISIFILNCAVTAIMFGKELGMVQVLIPLLFNVAFLAVIYLNRSYFKK